MRLLLLCLITGYAASAQQDRPSFPTSGPYSIAGVVVQHLNKQPITHARITIRSVDHNDFWFSCITGTDGGFAFGNLPEGKYSLAAEVHGTSEFFHAHDLFSTAVVVGKGIDTTHLVFPFTAPASLNVSVLDEEGDPVPGADVYAFRNAVASGWARIEQVSNMRTDSAGQCRMDHLRPGTYYIGVSGAPWYADANEYSSTGAERTVSKLDVAFPNTFYPETTDPAAASPLMLPEGGAADIHFALHSVPALHIDFVSRSEKETPENEGPQWSGPAFMPILSGVGPFGVEMGGNKMGLRGGPSGFGIGGIAPGRYLITLSGRGHAATPTRAGMVDLTSDTTIEALQLPETSIRGTVKIESAKRPGRAWIQNVNSGRTVFGPLSNDGSFSIRSEMIWPGKYEVLPPPGVPELYVKSVSVKGAPFKDGLIDLAGPSDVEMTLTLAEGNSKIAGVATKNNQPFAGALVLLYPDNMGANRVIPADQSDGDGSFTLYRVPPGRYTLIAIDDGDELAYQDPAVIRPYLPHGQRMTVPVASDQPVRAEIVTRLTAETQQPKGGAGRQ